MRTLRWSAHVAWANVMMVAALGSTACAPMSVGPPVVTDAPKEVFQRPTPNGNLDASIVQNGTDVSVQLSKLCDVTQVTSVERTTVREHVNDAPQNEWWAGIGGGVLIGTGALSVANPESIQPKDGRVSAQEVRGTGYALIGLGALLLAVPLIDYVRVHRVAERTVERVERAGPTVGRDARCGAPPAGTLLAARFPGSRNLPLATSDDRGAIHFDLDQAAPADWLVTMEGRTTLYVDGHDLGEVALQPLYEKREAAAWARATSSECDASLDERACDRYASYVAGYPYGEHAADARSILEAALQRRTAAADEAAWRALDLRACRAPAKRDTATLEASCAPLATYLARFPAGNHAEPVRDALDAGKALYARFEADEERRALAQASQPVAGNFIPFEGNGGGPTLCADGSVSNSSGSGTCSHHGGIGGGGHYDSGGGHRGSGGTHHAPRGGGKRR